MLSTSRLSSPLAFSLIGLRYRPWRWERTIQHSARIGNDYGFEQVFARELRGIAQPNDVFIGISTSGNSLNILAAVQVAKELSLRQMAWTGQTGGKLADQCECLRVPSTETARIQECHILVGHVLCELVEHQFFARRGTR